MNDAQWANAAPCDDACPGFGSRGPAKAEGHFIRGYGHSRKPQAGIELLPGVVEEATAFLADKSESLPRRKKVRADLDALGMNSLGVHSTLRDLPPGFVP
jgi:hypothetical protein